MILLILYESPYTVLSLHYDKINEKDNSRGEDCFVCRFSLLWCKGQTEQSVHLTVPNSSERTRILVTFPLQSTETSSVEDGALCIESSSPLVNPLWKQSHTQQRCALCPTCFQSSQVDSWGEPAHISSNINL